MPTQKCKYPGCTEDAKHEFGSEYCCKRHQKQGQQLSSSSSLSQADMDARLAAATSNLSAPIPKPTTKAISSNTGGPACPAPGSGTNISSATSTVQSTSGMTSAQSTSGMTSVQSTSGMTSAQRDAYLEALRIASLSGNPSASPSAAGDDALRCEYIYPNGKQCRKDGITRQQGLFCDQHYNEVYGNNATAAAEAGQQATRKSTRIANAQAEQRALDNLMAQKAQQIANQQSSVSTRHPQSWMFPETAILTISTHGSIILNKGFSPEDDNAMPMFDVRQVAPNIQKMWKFNAIVPGVVNIMGSKGEEDVHQAARSMKPGFFKDAEVTVINDAIEEAYEQKKSKSFNAIRKNVIDMAGFAVAFIGAGTYNGVKEQLKQQIQDRLRADRPFADKDDDNDELLNQGYVSGYDYGMKAFDCLKGGSTMINKSYLMQRGDSTIGEDWGIFCVNSLRPSGQTTRDQANIFDMVFNMYHGGRPDADGTRIIKLSEIVQFVCEHGAKNLIIIDLTCAPYQDSDLYLYSDRQVRRFNRKYLPTNNPDRKYGGRSSKRRNSKRRRSSRRRRSSSRRRN